MFVSLSTKITISWLQYSIVISCSFLLKCTGLNSVDYFDLLSNFMYTESLRIDSLVIAFPDNDYVWDSVMWEAAVLSSFVRYKIRRSKIFTYSRVSTVLAGSYNRFVVIHLCLYQSPIRDTIFSGRGLPVGSQGLWYPAFLVSPSCFSIHLYSQEQKSAKRSHCFDF